MKKLIGGLLISALFFSATALAELHYVSVRGFGGDMTVAIDLDENQKILNVTVPSHNETPGIGTTLMETPSVFDALRNQDIATAQIDTVSGATYTSDAINSALKEVAALYANPPLKNYEKGTLYELWEIPFGSSAQEVRTLLRENKSLALPLNAEMSLLDDTVVYTLASDLSFLDFPVTSFEFAFTARDECSSIAIKSHSPSIPTPKDDMPIQVSDSLVALCDAYDTLCLAYGKPDTCVVFLDSNHVYTLPRVNDTLDKEALSKIILDGTKFSVLINWKNVTLKVAYDLRTWNTNQSLNMATDFLWQATVNTFDELHCVELPFSEYGATKKLGLF